MYSILNVDVRNLIKSFLSVSLIVLLSCTAMADDRSPELAGTRPNIIFIFTDDLGYGDVESYNPDKIKTPNIDQIGESGIRFTEFYSASPVCSPSRAALMTGRYPIRQGIHDVFFPESWGGLPSGEVTIAEILKEAGYATLMVGKWHLGHRKEFLPLQHGFDEFFGVPYSNDMGGFYFVRGNEAIQEDVDQRYLTRKYTEASIEYIEKYGGRDNPFFLYLSHSMPHTPLHVSPEFKGRSEAGLYGDVIEELDWSTGQILDKIRGMGIEQKTLVVFSSDNGPWLLMGSHGGSAGILREGKGTTFEGGMRVPTMAYWKGRITPEQVVDNPAIMLDWFPTFAELAGVKLPPDLDVDGRDISALLIHPEKSMERDIVFYNHGKIEAYRSGDWKLKLAHQGDKPAFLRFFLPGMIGPHERLLFNLNEDPSEKTNLAGQFPEKVRVLKDKISQFQLSLGSVPPKQPSGKNMDYGGFIHVIKILLVKLIVAIAGLLILFYITIRLIKRYRKTRSTAHTLRT